MLCYVIYPFVSMSIVEIHEMDIISSKTTTKESTQTKTARRFLVALKRTVLNGFKKNRFIFFLNFSYEEALTVSFISF